MLRPLPPGSALSRHSALKRDLSYTKPWRANDLRCRTLPTKSGVAKSGNEDGGKFGHGLPDEMTFFSCSCIDLLRYTVIHMSGSLAFA